MHERASRSPHAGTCHLDSPAIPQETRQMLRRGRTGCAASPDRAPIPAARSLEALLSGNPTLASAGRADGGTAGKGLPVTPRSHSSRALPGGGSKAQGGGLEGVAEEQAGEGDSFLASRATAERADGREGAEEGEERGRRSDCYWGSDAPTPPFPTLEGGDGRRGSSTPSGCSSMGRARDRSVRP